MANHLDDVFPQGDPEAVFCRHCEAGRIRFNGHYFCRLCDSPQKAGVSFVATWDPEAKA